MGFEALAAVERVWLRRSTALAVGEFLIWLPSRRRCDPLGATDPCVLDALEPDVAVVAVEGLGDGVLAVGALRAVDAPAGQQAGELGDADAEDLLGQDVIDALLEVGDLVLEPLGEAAR